MNKTIDKLLLQKLGLIFADCLALVASLVIASLFLDMVEPGENQVSLAIFGLAKFGGIFLIAVFWYQEQYVKRRPTWEELRLLYRTIFIFALLHLVISYLVSHHVVKLLNILFWLILLVILPLLRHIAKILLNKLNLWQRNIYIVGTGVTALTTCDLLQQNKSLGYNVLGFIDLKSNKVENVHNKISLAGNNSCVGEELHADNGLPILNLAAMVNSRNTEVVFAMSSTELLEYSNIINLLQSRYIFVSIVPDISGLPLYGVELEHFFGNDQIFLRLQNNLGRKLNRWLKRSIDIVFTSIAIVILMPILVIISFMIMLSSKGQVFYLHKRIGIHGEEFRCIKFRTMCIDSKEKLYKLLSNDENARAEWEQTHKLKNDPRITKLGKFLRKTSLDELPQLFNVLIGEMSLVGPRPIVGDETKFYAANFYYYKLVRPGITGLWQISGRSDTDYARRVRLDVWYVKNWSLWYDFAILVKTIPVTLGRCGAY